MPDELAETKHDKFVRIRDARLAKTAHAVRLIGNLANTSTYMYSEREAEAIVTTLRAAVEDVAKVFKVPPVGPTTLTLEQSYARWALEELQRGDRKKAATYLKTAITHKDTNT